MFSNSLKFIQMLYKFIFHYYIIIMSIVESSSIYYIDSENRLNGTESNFTYSIEIPDSQKYDYVCVLSMTVPLSYYLIRPPFNTFTLIEGDSNVTITIPYGNYTANSFAAVVTGLLNSSSPNSFEYSMSLSNSYSNVNTGKYNYTVSGNNMQPQFQFGSRICQQMGFPENSTVTFIEDALQSSNVLDFIPSSTLFLHSDIVDDNTSVLQELYSNNTVQYSNHVYQCQSIEMYSKKLRSNKDNVFKFSIEDEHGVELDLNGHSFLFTLMLYKKNDFYDVFKRFIKYSYFRNEQQ